MSGRAEGWVEAKLSAVATARMGKTILSKELVASGLPVFSASAGSEPWGYVDDWSTVFPRGTLVISARGTIGDVKLPDHDSFVSTQTTIALQPSGAVVPSFLRSLLSAFDWPSVTATTAIPMLTISKLHEIGVAVPPLAEQRRIVAKLDALTARTARARADLDRIPALAARYKQAVLAKLLDALSRQAPRVAIGDVAEQIFDGPFGSNLKSDDYVDDGVRVVRLENIAHLSFVEEKRTFISDRKYSELRRHTLLPGDVLFSSFVDDKIRVCVFPTVDTIAINKADCFCVRPDRRRCDPTFLAYQLAAHSTYETFAEMVHGATRPRINLRQLKAFEILLPSRERQLDFVSRVGSAFAEIDRMATEAAAARRLLDRLDQAVLAKAFRGELVPQDPADEPASVLLDRIRAERAAAPKARRGRKPALA